MINPKNNKTVLSTMKNSIGLFFKIKNKIKNKKTVVNNCLANKKGSNIELEKTKGSKAKKSNEIKSKRLFLLNTSIKLK